MVSAKDTTASRVVIPRKLKMSLLKLQVDEDLSWEEACLSAATLLARQKRTIDRAVAREANRRYKSRHLKEMNKARKTIYDEGYWAGYNKAMTVEHFTTTCSRCGKPLLFSQTQRGWDENIQPMLDQTFMDRVHNQCLTKNISY